MKHALSLLALALGATLAFPVLAVEQLQAIDLSGQQAPIDAPRNPAAIAQIPANFRFTEPGTFTVAIPTIIGPPLALLADDNKTTIGSEADTARLIADSLGLKLKVVQATWEDWPLGVTSGKYDAVLSNITVTEARKKRFDFATYRQDQLGFYVKADSPIKEIKEAKDVSGLKVIVWSGTNQEKVLLAWNEENEKAGRKPAELFYYDDQAAANLALQSGRVDAHFAPTAMLGYIEATRGDIKRVGLINGGWPRQAEIAVTTNKGNGLVTPINTALEGVIAEGQYARVLQRWGLTSDRLDHSQINPPGLPD